jgi:hypothetical protein
MPQHCRIFNDGRVSKPFKGPLIAVSIRGFIAAKGHRVAPYDVHKLLLLLLLSRLLLLLLLLLLLRLLLLLL